MKQFNKISILWVLIAGVLFAQQKSESVESIMGELESGSPASVQIAPAPALAVSEEAQGVPRSVEARAVSPAKIHRVAEEKAMAAVDLEWGLTLRYYPVTDRFVKNMNLEGVDQAIDVADKFSIIDFPKGSSALYMPELQKLFVKNTPENLARLEEILSVFGEAETTASEQQVEIEARFVEFSEGALEELGFNWSNVRDGSDADLPGDWLLEEGETLFSDALRTVPFSQTETLGQGEIRATTGAWSANRIDDMFSDTAGTFELSGNIDGNAMAMLLRALDQTAGVDVLSAPSIVTLSGETASITVGEQHSYPELYEAGVSMGTVLHVRYEDFYQKILGVEMDVTPTIHGDEIKMEINPRITELLGWEQYELSPEDTSYTWYQYRVGQQFEHDSVRARLPIFKRREIQTEISIANGSTVALGGLIGEKTEAFEDRVPVLGSIPLVGRLFRSEGARTVKRNLTIFVTARKVAPNGRVVASRTFE